ncbi:alpha/beta hydrolase [Inquilinus sp. CA228]|uniref:alpha/beta hydrolase n=1 Tax=Inquilinus sp. CA228 TaxID=3455609 RepID=UPI003F8D276F
MRKLLVSLLALLPAGCSPLGMLNAALVRDTAVVQADIAYGAGGRQKLDLYQPRVPSSQPAAVVVFFYGGSWTSGERSDYRFVGQALAAEGIVAIVPDYRVAPASPFPAFVEDGAAVVAWAATNAARFGGDPDRIVLVGHSAGAYIAALLATDPSYLAAEGLPLTRIRGVVGEAGPYSFHPLSWAPTRNVFAGLTDEDKARPIAQVGPQARPMVLLHGAADDTVRPANTTEMAERLHAAGVPVETHLYPGLGHIGLLLTFYPAFRGKAPAFRDLVAAVRRF